MVLEPPDWLTLDFLDQCIRSREKYKRFRTTSFTMESAVPPGNNYGSIIHRVSAKLRQDTEPGEHSLSLIVKSPLVSGAIKELFDEIYESEPFFYNEFLTLGHKLLNRSFAPQHFFSPIRTIVVMEDLKEKGFIMMEKATLLDFDHCRYYVKAATDFHAMSFAVLKQKPEFIKLMAKEKMFSNDLSQILVTTNKNMLKYCLDCLAKHAAKLVKDEKSLDILRQSSAIIWDLIVEAMKPNYVFNTFNQGDPWLTNMMFKHDEDGKVCDIKLLDFQCIRYSSPITDLVFLIWSSANYDVLKTKQDTLYQLYVEGLNSTLDELKFKERITVDTVREVAKQMSPLVLWMVGLGRPMMNDSFVDMTAIFEKCKDEYSKENNPYDVLYTEDFCRDHLPTLVGLLEDFGVIEYMESKLTANNKTVAAHK